MADEVTLNQIGTMIEGLRSDVKAVAEGHGVIRREMREMKEELKADIKEVDDKLIFAAKDLGRKIEEAKQELKGDIRRVEGKLDEHMRLPAHV